MDLLGSRRHHPEFDEFVQLSGARLLKTAVLLTGDRASAEDLVQGALLATFTHWDKARVSPVGYATRALVNLCRDRWRREARRGQRRQDERSYEQDRSLNQELGPGDHLELTLARSSVVDAISSLPDRQREVVVMRYYLDQTVPEIAQILDIPEGTVKSTLSRALVRLRQLLEPNHVSLTHGGV